MRTHIVIHYSQVPYRMLARVLHLMAPNSTGRSNCNTLIQEKTFLDQTRSHHRIPCWSTSTQELAKTPVDNACVHPAESSLHSSSMLIQLLTLMSLLRRSFNISWMTNSKSSSSGCRLKWKISSSFLHHHWLAMYENTLVPASFVDDHW